MARMVYRTEKYRRRTKKIMYYQEIELKNFPDFDLDRIKGDRLFQYGEVKEETGVVQSFCLKENDYIIDIISKLFYFNVLPDWIGYVEIEGIGAPPHIDDHKTGLNLIIDDADSITCFWKKKENEKHEILETLPNEDSISKYYDITKCDKLGEFKAAKGSAWLYDLRTIHSVHRPNDNKVRKFISIRWYQDFDFITKSIQVL